MSRTHKDRLNDRNTTPAANHFYKHYLHSRRRQAARRAILSGNWDEAALDIPWDEWACPRDGVFNDPSHHFITCDGVNVRNYYGTLRGAEDLVRRLYKKSRGLYVIYPQRGLAAILCYVYRDGVFRSEIVHKPVYVSLWSPFDAGFVKRNF